MPIEKIIALASVIVAGIMATHPFTWRTELRKLEYSMLKEVSDTRSWGNPSIYAGHNSKSEDLRHIKWRLRR